MSIDYNAIFTELSIVNSRFTRLVEDVNVVEEEALRIVANGREKKKAFKDDTMAARLYQSALNYLDDNGVAWKLFKFMRSERYIQTKKNKYDFMYKQEAKKAFRRNSCGDLKNYCFNASELCESNKLLKMRTPRSLRNSSERSYKSISSSSTEMRLSVDSVESDLENSIYIDNYIDEINVSCECDEYCRPDCRCENLNCDCSIVIGPIRLKLELDDE